MGELGLQVYMPFKSFEQSAESLDLHRLDRQRHENLIVMYGIVGHVLVAREKADRNYFDLARTDWYFEDISRSEGFGRIMSHWVVHQWRYNLVSLYQYQRILCERWRALGKRDDDCLAKAQLLMDVYKPHANGRYIPPPFMGNPEYHEGHQAALLRKNYLHYLTMFPEVRPSNSRFYRGTGAR